MRVQEDVSIDQFVVRVDLPFRVGVVDSCVCDVLGGVGVDQDVVQCSAFVVAPSCDVRFIWVSCRNDGDVVHWWASDCF